MAMRYTDPRGDGMNILLALLSGIIVTVMISMNGELSDHYGIYVATVLIHLIGLITMIIVCRLRHSPIRFRNRCSIFLYTGGCIGVLTVFFNNLTIGAIGASLVSALGLLGQICASLLLEQYGWLGSLQSSITKEKLLSVLIIMIGIGVML